MGWWVGRKKSENKETFQLSGLEHTSLLNQIGFPWIPPNLQCNGPVWVLFVNFDQTPAFFPPERDKPICEGILSEKPLSLLDLVQGDKGILVGGEKLLDVSYGGNAVAGNFLWKRHRGFGNETGDLETKQEGPTGNSIS